MAATPEKKVKDAVRKILTEMKIYHFMPAANGFGRAGIPDIICCYGGRFLAIECKAGAGKTTALQDRELAAIRESRGMAYVVNETNIEELKETLQWMR
jgi:hypothetical protein